MAGKKVIAMQTLIPISVSSAKLKKDFQKMSEGTRKIVDKILKQKIEHNVESKSNGKKVIK